jgi:hypothetical protein
MCCVQEIREEKNKMEFSVTTKHILKSEYDILSNKARIDFVRNCTLSNSNSKHVLRASVGNKRGQHKHPAGHKTIYLISQILG